MTKNTLSTKEALRLNALLEKHIPDEISPNMLEFVGTIIRSMIVHNEQRNFVDALAIMYDYTEDDIVGLENVDAIQMFIEGFVKFDVWTLREFCKTLRNEANG